jgi:hypothetical protein
VLSRAQALYRDRVARLSSLNDDRSTNLCTAQNLWRRKKYRRTHRELNASFKREKSPPEPSL